MAAPEYVPTDVTDDPRVYGSPPRLPEPWDADRPGEVLHTGQPTGPMLGYQGPDLGYALALVDELADELVLAPGEHLEDALAGISAIAMRRAALFGRGPMRPDLVVAASAWGFFAAPSDELIELRRMHFAHISVHSHWVDRQRVVDMVPEAVLRRSHKEVRTDDWTKLELDTVDA